MIFIPEEGREEDLNQIRLWSFIPEEGREENLNLIRLWSFIPEEGRGENVNQIRAQSLLFCLMVGRLLVGSCGSIFRFLCHGR